MSSCRPPVSKNLPVGQIQLFQFFWIPLVNYHNYGKSPFFMGQFTISMAIFHSFLLVYRRRFITHDLRNPQWFRANLRCPGFVWAAWIAGKCPTLRRENMGKNTGHQENTWENMGNIEETSWFFGRSNIPYKKQGEGIGKCGKSLRRSMGKSLDLDAEWC